jgi:hypothetical protein
MPNLSQDAEWLRNLAKLRFGCERTDIGDRLESIAAAIDAILSTGDNAGLVERLTTEAIDRSIARLRGLPEYAGRPTWDQVVAEELRAAILSLTARNKALEEENAQLRQKFRLKIIPARPIVFEDDDHQDNRHKEGGE